MAPLAIGLMSGTSCDGVSAALVEFQRRRLRIPRDAATLKLVLAVLREQA